MADLVTHLAAGVLVKALAGAARPGWRSGLPAFLVGCVMPDAISRAPTIGMTALLHAGLPIPEPLIYGFYVLHMPLGLVPATWLAASLFEEGERPTVWANLLGGAALHMALDVLQRHWSAGYMLLYPFSTWHWEAGLIGPEDSVLAAGPLSALAGIAWWWTGRRRRGDAGDGSSAGPTGR